MTRPMSYNRRKQMALHEQPKAGRLGTESSAFQAATPAARECQTSRSPACAICVRLEKLGWAPRAFLLMISFQSPSPRDFFPHSQQECYHPQPQEEEGKSPGNAPAGVLRLPLTQLSSTYWIHSHRGQLLFNIYHCLGQWLTHSSSSIGTFK